MNDNLKKSGWEIAIDLLKVIAWPIVVLLIIILYWNPIYLVIDEIPNTINKSEAITIGSLSLKIAKKSTLQPSEKIKKALQGLSPEAIHMLIVSNGHSQYFSSDTTYGKEHYKELIAAGLYKEIEQKHLGPDPDHRERYYGVKPTELGSEVTDYLMKILMELLKEID